LTASRSTSVSSFAVAAGISLGAPVFAQDDGADASERYAAPVPIDRSQPRYPEEALQLGREGWVIVSYVVAEDGSVIEPMIEDSTSDQAFENAAIDAVGRWRFEPATLNGEPVEQSMTRVRIVFAMQGVEPGVSRDFRRNLEEIQAGLGAGDLAKVEEILTEIEFERRRNLTEDAWYWWSKFVYLDASGSTDVDAKIDSLKKAVGYEIDYLPPDTFITAAQRLYAIQAQAFDLGAAMSTYARLRDSSAAKRSASYASALAALEPSYQRIVDAIAEPNTLAFNGRIGEHDYWVHTLLRRSFSLAGIQGRVSVVDVRCDRGTRRYDTLAEGNVWNVPASWGECGIYIGGDVGTTFTFNEHPADAASAEAAPQSGQ
jgi:TonB family protein